MRPLLLITFGDSSSVAANVGDGEYAVINIVGDIQSVIHNVDIRVAVENEIHTIQVQLNGNS